MLSKKFLSKSLKHFSLRLATSFLIGAFLNFPGLAMETNDQEKEFFFHPLAVAEPNDFIIRANPKSFAVASREYHAYVCQKEFMMMYIGKHKVDKYRYRLKYEAKYATNYSPEHYKWTEAEELSLLQSLDKRQISKIDDYALPLPPIRVSDYHTDVVLDLINKPEIPIRELELWHTFNTHIAGEKFFYKQGAGGLSKSTIVELIASSRREEIQREVGNEAFSQERLRVIFDTIVSPLYPTEREKYIKPAVLKRMILLLDRIANNKTLQTLKVCCDGLDLIEDELLETLGKNANLTSLSINPTQVPPFWLPYHKQNA